LIPNPPASSRLPIGALAVVLVLVVAAAAAGVAMAWAANPAPSGAFARCKTAPQVAPHIYQAPPATCIDLNKPYSATILTTKGDITLTFLVGAAPVTVNNFIVLAVNGYFTGDRFFNVQDWFVQSGDPTNSGRGGPGYTLPDEPSPADAWVPGSVGMARFPAGISGSQFFITKLAWPGGNPSTAYNHFATVTLGFDIVGQLTTDDRILRVDVKRG
jgi:cyclophilin family peptidyl-prolyl cis-trans isomerase